MTNCLTRLREILNTLPVTERDVALVILESPIKAAEMPIRDLAELSGVSPATVVRLSKRMGYNGYKELCRALSVDLALQSADTVYSASGKDSSPDQVIRDAAYADIKAIENTLSLIDSQMFTKAVDAIAAAPRVDFYGVGTSGTVALDASLKFLRLNKNSVNHSDPFNQCISATTLKTSDVAVFISYSGTTYDTIDTLKVAKNAGALTVSITKAGTNPLSELADISLYTDGSESAFSDSNTASRIGQLVVIDMLYKAVSAKISKQVKHHYDETQLVLVRKKLRTK